MAKDLKKSSMGGGGVGGGKRARGPVLWASLSPRGLPYPVRAKLTGSDGKGGWQGKGGFDVQWGKVLMCWNGGGVEKQTGTGMQTGAATRLSHAINQSGQKASNRQGRRMNLSPRLGFRLSRKMERKRGVTGGKT